MKVKHLGVCFLLLTALFITGCGRQNQSTISVFGTGTILVQPDLIQMYITLSNVARTTKIAQEEVSRMVRQALAVLKEADIEDKNISTTSLTFNSEYEYRNNGRVLLGQKAEQRITFSIDEINNDSEKVSRIIDQLIQINGIALNQIKFSVRNNTEYFIKSRDLAFQKAVEKAEQYAELSKLRIVKVLSVSEEGNQQISSMNNRLASQQLYEAAMEDSVAGSTVVPTGELEITTRILVVFLLK
ncbi:MAG: SIMPL domain-containing protein [Treponema sp.]|jgi:uncharacterized protein YggE|nr:SIMPL domain-containing protein [Treponema sp.]